MTTTIFAAASEPQLDLIECLRRERLLSDYARERLASALADGMTRTVASQTISWLKNQPYRRLQDDPNDLSALVPAGRYAVSTEEGHLAFYRVDKPAEGRWAGYVFLSVQASDEHHRISNRTTRLAILAKIAMDPAGAAKRYGLELGHCGVCGRTLTDETSRAYGIGPICREKTGW